MTTLPGLGRLLADPPVSDVLEGKRDGVLALDYDGTLAPFQPRRDLALPYPGVAELLARLPAHGPGRFAVVSGREAGEIANFLSPAAPMEIWGCHGAQRLLPGGLPQTRTLPPQWEQSLHRALELAARLAPPQSLEKKSVSLAWHWRGLDAADRPSLARRIRRAWASLARESGLELRPFDGGLELRPSGWDKGRAIRALRRENPGAIVVYLGDDRTDEDAFRALGPSDAGVLVRANPRPTAAHYRITPPGELLRFLSHWAAATGNRSTAAKEAP